jgi:hypothetical protein
MYLSHDYVHCAELVFSVAIQPRPRSIIWTVFPCENNTHFGGELSFERGMFNCVTRIDAGL